MTVPYASLTEYFAKRAKDSPAEVVYSDGNTTTRRTMGEVYALSLRIGKALSAGGLKKGDAVALMASNRPEWMASYMGVISAGGHVVPLDIHLTAVEVKNLVRDARPKFFIVEREVLKKIRDKDMDDAVEKYVVLDAGINYLRKGVPFDRFSSADAAGWETVPSGLEDVASLIYTSGTTGTPKGVPLTHRNLLSQSQIYRKEKCFDASHGVLLILPLNHAYAFSSCFLSPLELGQPIHILNSLKRTDLLKFVKKEKTAVLVLVPAIIELLHQGLMEQMHFAPNTAQMLFHSLKANDLFSRDGTNFRALKRKLFGKIHAAFGGNVRFVVSGAAGLDEDVARTLNTLGLAVLEGYGLTETSPVVAVNRPHRTRPGTVGPPFWGVDIRILEPDGQGIGEICVKGDPVFKGYRNHDNAGIFTEDGYFRTGDLGRLSGGLLSINGRAKDVIVLPSGKNVFPDEIEAHLLTSEYIREAAVFGVPLELGKKAEAIYAVVVPNANEIRRNAVENANDFVLNLAIDLSEQLPTWCRVANFRVQSEPLPRTTTRKIKKFLLRDQVLEEIRKTGKLEMAGHAAENDPLLTSPMGRIFGNAVAHVKGADARFSAKSHLFVDLGFDSISVSELLVTLEKSLGLAIPKDLAYQLRTVRDAVTMLGDFGKQNDVDLEAAAARLGETSVKQTSWNEVIAKNIPKDISDEIDRRVGHASGATAVMQRGLTSGFSVLSRIVFRLKAEGLQNLPDTTKFIIAADHLSYSDPLFVQWVLPAKYRRKFFFIGKKENLQRIDRTVLGWIARMIPIDREGNFVPALQAGKCVIDADNILLIHPEGTPSPDRLLGKFKNGVGILGEVTGAPIVPVHLEGTFEALPKHRNLPRLAAVTVHFGKPVLPGNVSPKEGEKRYDLITKAVEERIIELGAKPRSAS